VVGDYFKRPLAPQDVVWSYSGVRPLFDEGGTSAQETTRDFVLERSGEADEPPLLNIFGGKITTYRRLAESMLEKIEALIGSKGEPWTAEATLPGGDFPMTGYDDLVAGLQRDFPFLADKLARRLARAYGTDTRSILDDAKCLDDLGEMFGTDLSEAEVNWLVGEEWARTADDILWRRSKLGLRFNSDETSALAAWLASTGKPSSQSAAGQG
jgi:glycerol-3-phosphate dehydrogenase